MANEFDDAREVMDGTWKSRDILGNLADDFLALAPFGEAVPGDGQFLAGKAQVFQGPLKDNKGVERVKAGGGGRAGRPGERAIYVDDRLWAAARLRAAR